MVNKILDNSHMAKVILYNEEVLGSNPCRTFIISVLTNLLDMVLIKSELVLDEKGKSFIIHRISQHINFWTQGYKYIIQMYNLPETVGYNEMNNFQIMLSSGYIYIYIYCFNDRPKHHFCFISHFSEFDEPIQYQLFKPLGKGLTARVFSLIASNEMEERHDLIVKIFERNNIDYFKNEQDIMDKIAQRFRKPEYEEGKYNFLFKPPK